MVRAVVDKHSTALAARFAAHLFEFDMPVSQLGDDGLAELARTLDLPAEAIVDVPPPELVEALTAHAQSLGAPGATSEAP